MKQTTFPILHGKIEDILLEFAPLFNDLSTSDLQGVASVKAKEIVKLVREAVSHDKPRT